MERKLSIFLLILSIFFFHGCGQQEEIKNENTLVEVGYITLKEQAVPVIQEISGRVRAKYIAEVRPQVSGIIKEQYFSEGSFVNKGDLLYKIDPDTYQATFNEAQALLKSAEADLVSIELKYNRHKELVKIGGISKQEADDTKAAYFSAIALVEQRKASLMNAKIDLDRTDIKAPISGYIGISSVTKGALVTASQTNALATIRYTDFVFVDLSQSSSQLLNLRSLLSQENVEKGSAKVTLVLIDGSSYSKSGELQLQEVAVNESTGSITLRAEFENQDGILLPGMYVRALVEGAINLNTFLVPQQAVERDSRANPIITVINEDNSIKQKIIQVSRAENNQWVVTDGITQNDKIIIEGLNRINLRSKVFAVDVSEKYVIR